MEPRLLLLLVSAPWLASALTGAAVGGSGRSALHLPSHAPRTAAAPLLMKAGKGKGKGSRREQRRQRRESEGDEALPDGSVSANSSPETRAVAQTTAAAPAAPPAAASAQAASAQAAVEKFTAATSAAFDVPSAGDGKISSISESLPSLDDFKKRDDAAAAKEARRGSRRSGRSEVSPPATLEATPSPSAADAPQSATEKLMELFAFDAIDERPAVELDEYDTTARYIGRGLPNKAGAYVLPYLQSGHMLLLGVLLLSTFVTYPGFPLTQVPDEYRDLLKEGLVLTYVLNFAAAFYSRGIAIKKEQPAVFWMVKVALLGGLALGELTEAVPEPKGKRKKA